MPDGILRVKGPFYGLNERADETLLGPRYAVDLNNVLLDNGAIRLRPGFSRINQTSDSLIQIQAFVLEENIQEQSAVVGLSSEKAHVWRGPSTSTEAGMPYTLSHAASMSLLLDRIVIASIDYPLPVVWDLIGAVGEGTYTPRPAGLNAPQPSGEPWFVAKKIQPDQVHLLPVPKGTYRFALSFYKETRYGIIESSAHIDTEDINTYVDPVIGAFDGYVEATCAAADFALADGVRLYALHVLDEGAEETGEATYRLVADVKRTREEHFTILGSVLYIDFDGSVWDDSLSTDARGPHAPTRNGRPPRSNVVCLYNDMMLYSSVEDGHVGDIYFSQIGEPEHVAATDFFRVPDDTWGRTTAMVVYQGRLIIFKERAIYVLSGQINRRTNSDVALGNPSPPQDFQVFRAVENIGCYNTDGGVGAIECDGVLYFNAVDGVYSFDGLTAKKVSDPIKGFFNTLLDKAHRIAMLGNDTVNGRLWVSYQSSALCYDYRRADPATGVGIWTKHTVSGLSCICTLVPWGEGVDDFWNDDLLFGVVNGALCGMREGATDDNLAFFDWSYKTAALDFDLPDRSKLLRYLTVHHTNKGSAIYLSCISEREEDGDLVSKDVTIPTIQRNTTKLRVAQRGIRFWLLFSGGVVTVGYPELIRSFTLEAETLGYR